MRRMVKRYAFAIGFGSLVIWLAPDFVQWWVAEKPTTITISP